MKSEFVYRRFQFLLGASHPTIAGILFFIHSFRTDYSNVRTIGYVLMFLVSCRLGMFLIRRSKNMDAQFGSVGIDKNSSETKKDSVDLTATICTVLLTFFTIYVTLFRRA